MGLNFSSSKSKSTPLDMTPEAFKGLQGPLAQRLMGLMGFTQNAPQKNTGATTPAPVAGPMIPNPNAFTNPTGDHSGAGPQYILHKPGQPAFLPNGQTQGPAAPSYGFNGGADGLGGVPTYNGPLTAALGGNEKSILDMLMKQANGSAPDSEAVAGLKEFMRRGLSGDAATDNPFLQSYIEAAQRPTLQGLTETLTRDLPGRFTKAGQFVQPQSSSAFDRAAAIATRGASDAIGDIATNISYQQVNDAQNRGLDAAKSIPGATAQEVDTLIKNLQAQALPRLIQEQGIERGLTLFQTRLDALLKTLGITAGVTQPTIANKQEGKSSGFGFSLG